MHATGKGVIFEIRQITPERILLETSYQLIVLDVITLEELLVIDRPASYAFSQDNRQLAEQDAHGGISLWDLRTLEKRALQSLPALPAKVTLQFSPGGELLALSNITSSEKQDIYLLDTASGEVTAILHGPSGTPAEQVRISPDMRYLASIGQDGLSNRSVLAFWNLETQRYNGRAYESFLENQIPLQPFHPIDNTFFTSSRYFPILVWNPDRAIISHRLPVPEHITAVSSLVLSGDGSLMDLNFGEAVLETSSGAPAGEGVATRGIFPGLGINRVHDRLHEVLAMNGEYLAKNFLPLKVASFSNRSIRILSSTRGSGATRYSIWHPLGGTSAYLGLYLNPHLDVSPNYRSILICSNDTYWITKLRRGPDEEPVDDDLLMAPSLPRASAAQFSDVMAGAFTTVPTTPIFAPSQQDFEFFRLGPCDSRFAFGAFSQNGAMVAVVGGHIPRVYNTADGKELVRFGNHTFLYRTEKLYFSPNNGRLLSIARHVLNPVLSEIHVWEVNRSSGQAELLWDFHWDSRTRIQGRPAAHEARIMAAAFSQGGDILALALSNGSVQFWDWTNSRLLHSMQVEPLEPITIQHQNKNPLDYYFDVVALHFLPGDRGVVAVGTYGSVKLLGIE